MNAAWHAEKARQAKELRDAAREVDTAQREAADARNQAQRLPVPRAELLNRAPALGPVVATAADALRALATASTSPISDAATRH